jgi:hypothetical protein
MHNDYTDLSKLDVTMKKIMPFWVWRSRNLPLQAHLLVTSNYAGRAHMAVAAREQQKLKDDGDSVALPGFAPASAIPIDDFGIATGLLGINGFSGAAALQDIAGATASGDPLAAVKGVIGLDGLGPAPSITTDLLRGKDDNGKAYNLLSGVADANPLASELFKTLALGGTDLEGGVFRGFDGRTSVQGVERLLALLGLSTPDYSL